MHSESKYSRKKRGPRTEFHPPKPKNKQQPKKPLTWQMEEMEPTEETENEQVEILEGNQNIVQPWDSRRR